MGYSPWGRKELDTTERRSNNRAPSCQPWASAPWGGRRASPGWHSGSSPATGGQGCSVLGLSPALALAGVGGLVRTCLGRHVASAGVSVLSSLFKDPSQQVQGRPSPV